MTTLIVGTDGSELAIEAARAGLSLTRPVDKVVIVSVVDDSNLEDASGLAGPTMTPDQVEEHEREIHAEGRDAVEATAEALRGVTSAPACFETLVLAGDAGPALCHLATEVRASALIVGSRGRGGLKRALLGSVSDYIVRNAPCSVVVSRAP